jgi:TRAP-type C4-dicarboxylate transport system permease small subunit
LTKSDNIIFVQRYVKVQEGIIACLLAVITLFVFGEVVLRYVFKAPLLGIEELTTFPTIWLYMLGGANASAQRNHIECGVASVFIKNPIILQLVDILRCLLTIIIGLLLSNWAWGLFRYSLKVWKTSAVLYIPLFLGESALFVGLILMVFFAVLEIRDSLILFRKIYHKRCSNC